MFNYIQSHRNKFILLAFLLVLSGCGSSEDYIEEDTAYLEVEDSGDFSDDEFADAGEFEDSGEFDSIDEDSFSEPAIDAPETPIVGNEPAPVAAAPSIENIILFAFDRSEIKGSYLAMLEAHAQYLTTNPTQRVRIEGHTDERGTPEYNIALGERRATSVKNVLMQLGVLPQQIDIISYGEEVPADPGHNAQSWSLNRRAVIVY